MGHSSWLPARAGAAGLTAEGAIVSCKYQHFFRVVRSTWKYQCCPFGAAPLGAERQASGAAREVCGVKIATSAIDDAAIAVQLGGVAHV